MALSGLDLCSKALLKVGANPISSFDDGSAEAEVAANLYVITRNALLSSHPWNFATTQSALGRLDIVPIADFTSAFQLPIDCLRVLSAGTGGLGRGLSYKVVGRQLHTNAQSVILTYIFYPHELTFPPFFDMALIAQLAAEFCIPLTESTSRWESFHKLADSELRKAKLIDAQEETPTSIEDFTLVEGRL